MIIGLLSGLDNCLVYYLTILFKKTIVWSTILDGSPVGLKFKYQKIRWISSV